MPVNEYFSGHGDEVMSSMKRQYGSKRGKSVFYATAAKRNQNAPKMRRKIASRKSLSK